MAANPSGEAVLPLGDVRALYCIVSCKDVLPYHSFDYDIEEIDAAAAAHEAAHQKRHFVRTERAGDVIAGRAHYVCSEVIEKALVASGFEPGRHHRGGGYGWSPAEYEPPVAGFVHKWTTVYEWSADGGKTWMSHLDREYEYGDLQSRQRSVMTLRHAGKGRKDALPRYVDALRDHGFVCELRVLDDLTDRQPIIVIEGVDLARYRASHPRDTSASG